jgi:hypothetical protein
MIFFYGWYFLKDVLGVFHFSGQLNSMLEGQSRCEFFILKDLRPSPFSSDTTLNSHQPSFYAHHNGTF